MPTLTPPSTGNGGQRDESAHSPAARNRLIGYDNTQACQPAGRDRFQRTIDHEPVAKRCIGIGNAGTCLTQHSLHQLRLEHKRPGRGSCGRRAIGHTGQCPSGGTSDGTIRGTDSSSPGPSAVLLILSGALGLIGLMAVVWIIRRRPS